MKQAIAVAAFALLAGAFALESAFYLALSVPQMGQEPVLVAGSSGAAGSACVPGDGRKC